MTARHPLDRPIWSALATRQASLAEGSGRALRFAPDYEPFAAALDDSIESLRELAGVVSPGGTLLLLQRGESPTPPGTVVAKQALGVQLVFDGSDLPGAEHSDFPIRLLDAADVPDMRALAELTQPGPWCARTHELGDFHGIRVGGRLAAMAGERMKLPGFGEVSGVATHPDFRGRGYAAVLTRLVAARILARGETPFLHAYASNAGAIALYERLGFRVRCEMIVTVLARAPA